VNIKKYIYDLDGLLELSNLVAANHIWITEYAIRHTKPKPLKNNKLWRHRKRYIKNRKITYRKTGDGNRVCVTTV